MTTPTIFKLVILFASAVGLYAAHYIRSHKKRGTPLVCPLESNCEAVVHSEYSRFFGIPLEIIGYAYYILVIIAYLIEIIFPNALPVSLVRIIVAVSVAAFFFSLYLTGLQLFKIKEWCTWCLVSATMCLIIFIATIFLYGVSILSLSF